MAVKNTKAPELQVEMWLNTQSNITLQSLKGKVVVIYAFQMLCPGCVEHSVPQSRKVNDIFSKDDVAVLGLHTVFEHHEAMTAVSLKAFLHEYRIGFPVGIDQTSGNGEAIPKTMKEYGTGGTPTLLLIDRQGYLRKHKMGHEDDIVLGAEIMSLIKEPA